MGRKVSEIVKAAGLFPVEWFTSEAMMPKKYAIHAKNAAPRFPP